jgi:Bacterial antitoxin of type II TA system, VapB
MARIWPNRKPVLDGFLSTSRFNRSTALVACTDWRTPWLPRRRRKSPLAPMALNEPTASLRGLRSRNKSPAQYPALSRRARSVSARRAERRPPRRAGLSRPRRPRSRMETSCGICQNDWFRRPACGSRALELLRKRFKPHSVSIKRSKPWSPSNLRPRSSSNAAPSVWFFPPYSYGRIRCMKKTFNVDDKLFKEAKGACGATTDTETIRLGLEALVRHAAYERLRALRGTEPHVRDVPRRRERASTRRRVA